jgi:hypothetical protein
MTKIIIRVECEDRPELHEKINLAEQLISGLSGVKSASYFNETLNDSYMDNREKILRNINETRSLLLDTYSMLYNENKDGKQFDYCTSARLADEFDAANNTMYKIGKMIYQER